MRVSNLASKRTPAPAGRAVTAISTILVVLACLLAPLAITASWVRTTVSDTDRYVATVAPLAEETAVQAAVADHLTVVLMDALDEDGALSEAVAALMADLRLPARASDLLVLALEPVRVRLGERVHTLALDVMASDAFATAWRDSNESAHRRLVDALSGDESDVEAVRLDLATAVNTLRAELIAREVPFADQIPQVEASFTLVDEEQLRRVREAYQLLDGLATGLLIAAVLTAAGGITLARRRRRAVAGWLGGCLVAFLATLLLLAVGDDILVGRTDADGSVIGPVWDILTARLEWLLWIASAIAAGALACVWVTDPGARARTLRGRLGRPTP